MGTTVFISKETKEQLDQYKIRAGVDSYHKAIKKLLELSKEEEIKKITAPTLEEIRGVVRDEIKKVSRGY